MGAMIVPIEGYPVVGRGEEACERAEQNSNQQEGQGPIHSEQTPGVEVQAVAVRAPAPSRCQK